MDLLFSVANPVDADNIMVSDSDFESHYPGINTNTRWATISPYIRQATQKNIIPYISRAMYDELTAYYADTDPANEMYDEVIEHLKDAIAHYSIYMALPHLNVVIGDLGVGQNRPTEGNFNATGQWQFKEAQRRAMLEADAAMDRALAVCEREVADENADFDTYSASTARQKFHPFFRTMADLQKYVDIRESFRTFLAIVPNVDVVYTRHLRPIVGVDMTDELKTELSANDLSADNVILLDLIRKPLALYSVLESLGGMAFIPEGDGVRITTDGTYTVGLAQDFINDYKKRLLSNAKMYAAELYEYLYANADDYATWKASDRYLTSSTAREILTSDDRNGAIML